MRVSARIEIGAPVRDVVENEAAAARQAASHPLPKRLNRMLN
jgi:hypothetical protein